MFRYNALNTHIQGIIKFISYPDRIIETFKSTKRSQYKIQEVTKEPRKVLSTMADKKEAKTEGSLVVVSRVQDVVSKNDCMMGGDFPAALSEKVDKLIKEACERTKNFGKKTVGPESL
jgi:hypothetical protein